MIGESALPLSQLAPLSPPVTEHLQRLYPPSPAPNVVASGTGYVVDYGGLEYVEPYDRNLDCPICQSPFVNPIKLNCEHVFCSECLDSAMRDAEVKNCPTCRAYFRVKDMKKAQRLISTIVDDLMVKCPLSSKGCTAIVSRGTLADHVNIHCDYFEVMCPSEKCRKMVRRKDTRTKECLHTQMKCTLCKFTITKLDFDDHLNHYCTERATCPHCSCRVSRVQLEKHKKACPEGRLRCDGASYGCPFTAQSAELETHHSTCVIKTIPPFHPRQASRLAEHEAALQLLRRQNSVYRASISNIQEILTPASPHDTTAQRDQAVSATHLLLMHEALQREVNETSERIAEVDARTHTMLLNDRLLHKEEMMQINAALSSNRLQTQWLMSNRCHATECQTSRRGASVPANAEAGPSSGTSGNVVGITMSNPFASGRQDPKL